jgi:hypothetical protein
MRIFFITIFLFALSTHGFAQYSQTTEAVYREDLPTLDGVLTEDCWQHISPLKNFTTSTPAFGATPKAPTEVRVFYGPNALYVGVYCFVSTTLRDDKNIRDGDRTGDWFTISLDTWNDDRLTFDFTVTAAGVQMDYRDGTTHWDAVWQSAIARHADGWSAEIRIPYTALRFHRKPEQDWGLQLTRFDRASGEISTWSPHDPLVNDRVLQFGEMTGLRDLKQEQRRSLAIQTENKLGNFRESPSTSVGNIGLDGRIGLNGSSTLDFTVLPPRQYNLHFERIINGDVEWLDGYEVHPRQFSAEEDALFSKNPHRIQDPSVHPASLLWRLIKDSSEIFEFQSGASSRVLQSSKLTTRGQGDWRMGILNTLLSPVKAKMLDPRTFNSRKETLQGISNYNFVTLERILPNNGFVNLSNGTLLAGPGHRSFAPSLSFQLRNQANEYELSGASDWAYDLRNKKDEHLRHGYYISLARINRRWGWNLVHSDRDSSFRATQFITPFTTLPNTNVGVSFRDFRPHGIFLNRFAALNIRLDWRESISPASSGYLYGNFSGLDKAFRDWKITYFAYPQNTVRYSVPSKFLDRRLASFMGGAFTFQSDNRKRLIWDATVGGDNSLKSELPRIRAGLGTTWVPLRQWLLRGSLQTSRTFNDLLLLSAPGMWIFERRNAQWTSLNMTAAWFPATNWRLWFATGISTYSYSKRENVELMEGGALTPSAWPLEAKTLNSDNRFGYSFGFQRFFNQISQLRFQIGHFWLPQPESNTVLVPVLTNYGSDIAIDLGCVWFLNGNR